MIIECRVSPNSSRNEIKEESQPDNFLRIYTTAPAVEGKANKAVIKLLSKYFKIPKTSIEIKSGINNKNKKIEFHRNSKSLEKFVKSAIRRI